MKSKNLFIGILLLFAGVVALLAALGTIEFHWSIVWSLWPLLLIIIGISILPVKEYLKGILLLVALGLGCVLYQSEMKHYEGNGITRFFNNHVRSWRFWTDDDVDDIDDNDESEPDESYPFDQHFSESYAAVERASINIDFGAGELELKQPCAELVKVDATSNFVKYSFRTESKDDETFVYLSGQGHTKTLSKKTENEVAIALCAQPTWDFTLEMGAAEAGLDFTPYKVERLKINGGACDINLKLGDSGCNTIVDISTGVSDIDIKVPQGVDCQINVDSAISGKDFTGFEKVGKGLWQTPDFGAGTHPITINLNCAVSDISIERY